MNEIEFYLEDLKSKFSKINFKEYYLSYSGGMDSHFLFWFIKEYLKDSDIEIVSVNTRMEFPEISNRMIKNADRILIPSLKPHEVIKKYGSPCFSKSQDTFIERYQKGCRSKSLMDRIERKHTFINSKTKQLCLSSYNLNKLASELLLNNKLPKISAKCCNKLKKEPLKLYEKLYNKKAIIGVRGGESILRGSKYKGCFTKNKKFTPLYDLPEELLKEIYIAYNIENLDIYKYLNQTGCAGCPYGIFKNHTEKELSLMTKAKRKYVLSLFREVYNIRGVKYETR